jgi:hypothetical protein
VSNLNTKAHCHPVESFHDEVGFNYRMTNVQAAIAAADGGLKNDSLSNAALPTSFATCATDSRLSFMPQANWEGAVLWCPPSWSIPGRMAVTAGI